MTIEEAIVVLKCAMPNSSIRCVVSDDEKEEAITMAIEALEREENPNSIRINFVGEKEAEEFDDYLKNQQEPILDKISTEIKAIDINGQVDEHTMFIRSAEQVKQMALEVIDKYNEESKEE